MHIKGLRSVKGGEGTGRSICSSQNMGPHKERRDQRQLLSIEFSLVEMTDNTLHFFS